jgi:hypothetical protein
LKRDGAHFFLKAIRALLRARLPNCRLVIAVLPNYHPVVTRFPPAAVAANGRAFEGATRRGSGYRYREYASW